MQNEHILLVRAASTVFILKYWGCFCRFEPGGGFNSLVERGIVTEWVILDFRRDAKRVPLPGVLYVVFASDLTSAAMHDVDGDVPESVPLAGKDLTM